MYLPVQQLVFTGELTFPFQNTNNQCPHSVYGDSIYLPKIAKYFFPCYGHITVEETLPVFSNKNSAIKALCNAAFCPNRPIIVKTAEEPLREVDSVGISASNAIKASDS